MEMTRLKQPGGCFLKNARAAVAALAIFAPLLSSCGSGTESNNTILTTKCNPSGIQLLGTPMLKTQEAFPVGKLAKIRVDAIYGNEAKIDLGVLDRGGQEQNQIPISKGNEELFSAPVSHPNDYGIAVRFADMDPAAGFNTGWVRLEVRCCGCK